MAQPSAKSILTISIMASLAAIPSLIYSIIKLNEDPTDFYNYIPLVSSLFIILLLSVYIIGLFALGRKRLPPESDY